MIDIFIIVMLLCGCFINDISIGCGIAFAGFVISLSIGGKKTDDNE